MARLQNVTPVIKRLPPTSLLSKNTLKSDNVEYSPLDSTLLTDFMTSDEEESTQNDGTDTIQQGNEQESIKWVLEAEDKPGEGLQVKESGSVFKIEATSGITKTLNKQQLQKHYQNYLEEAAKRDQVNVLDFEEFCKAVINNWWKKKRQQSEKKKHKKHKKKASSKEEKAAKVIQRAWRRYIDKEVFHYYRDLINFRCYGDPAMMLRCVNPKEASLLDAAAGIHVRFRLGGEKFPPSIYYKIFTHRPVQDLCANAPRDYTRPEAKKSSAKVANNRVENSLPQIGSRTGWYERVENNGWRLVSDRLLNYLTDPVTYRTANKPVVFHHNKLKRKKDIEVNKKKKKVEWMKKLYQEGILKANSDDHTTIKLVENAAEGLVNEYEKKGLKAVKDWEVDELLSWTNSLNFDDYWNDWKTMGTTTFSEDTLDNFTIQPLDKDPYSFSMSSKQRTATAFKEDDSPNKSSPMPYHRAELTNLSTT